MERNNFKYRFLAVVVALSFVYTPLSGVIPSWLGLGDGSFHIHSDHVWQASDDHHHMHGSEDVGFLETPHLGNDAREDIFSASSDHEQQNRHAPHMHFVDILMAEGLVVPPAPFFESGEIEASTSTFYAFTAPLLKPPRVLA